MRCNDYDDRMRSIDVQHTRCEEKTARLSLSVVSVTRRFGSELSQILQAGWRATHFRTDARQGATERNIQVLQS